jgi:hypothetical protein
MNILAELTLPGGNAPIPDPVGSKFPNIAALINVLMRYVFVLSGIALLIVILSAGFTLLTSGGDVKAVEKGKKNLTNGLIGFILIFTAYWLVQLVGIVFGIPEIKDIFK